ncbi:MAG: DUF547 domain-containing protein [Nonlabens sp.]|uniref:DUF547 domain-containing protein n=1 Tax=Nonlabens sp. TaxID=1888209 RepID=UPI003EF69C0F
MHKRAHIIITVVLILITSSVVAQIDVFNQRTQAVLNLYVKNGLVDYQSLKQDSKSITILKESIAHTKSTDLTPQELKAFLINAYNMTVIVSITENYPTTSVMDIDGFFDKKKHQVAERLVTLNELEKDWLFKKFPDARLHFALVCGAISCPPLKGTPFNSQNTETRLEKLTRATLNDSEFVSIDMHEKTATVSKLFEWYKTDFNKKGNAIVFINKYSDKKIPDGFALNFKVYNWNLNQQ